MSLRAALVTLAWAGAVAGGGPSLLALRAAAPQPSAAGEPLERAFAAIADALSGSTAPGIVVSVTDRERTLKLMAHGMADIKTKRPMTTESLVGIGSISKSFTAVALMQLADEGRFDPQAPLKKHLPWFEVKSRFPPITGHHLLTHTAGLQNYRPDLASMRYAAYALRDFEPSYAPGSHYWYSNIGFQVLGYALEHIDRGTYPEIIERRILRPLGMSSTTSAIDDTLRSRLPVSYRVWPYDGTHVEQPWFEYRAADGSIVATAGDMASYMRMLLNRGAAAKGRVLSERAFQVLTTPALDGYAYGLTVRQQDGHTVIGHAGGIAGFVTQMEVDIQDGVGVFIGGTAGFGANLPRWTIEAVKAAVRGQSPPAPPQSPQAIVRATVGDCAGVYTAPSGKSLEFVATATGLSLKTGGESVALIAVGRDRYRAPSGDASAFPFVFERTAGKVAEMTHGPDWYVTAAYTGPKEFKALPEYDAFIGRYDNHNPESGPVRVFVRKGQFLINGALVVEIAPGEFRPATPAHNPERYRFDSIVDGRALRLLSSGMPMYRSEGR